MTKENFKALIGDRILCLKISNTGYSFSRGTEVIELKVLEISPTGDWVKVMNDNGMKIWKKREEIEPIEILERKEKSPLPVIEKAPTSDVIEDLPW
jgi:hypothetical protein